MDRSSGQDRQAEVTMAEWEQRKDFVGFTDDDAQLLRDLRPWGGTQLTFAGIGNIEVRVFGSAEPMNFLVRHGIVGLNAPIPAVRRHRWQLNSILALHSDGLTTRWRWEDFSDLQRASASVMARRLLQALARDDDDATVLVVKGRDEMR